MNATDTTRRLNANEGSIVGLQGSVKTLQDTLAGLPTPLELPGIPHWQAVKQTSGTFTPGTDWESQFDDLSATNRLIHTLYSHGGEISHVNSDSAATRLTVHMSAQGGGTLSAHLGIVGTGRVQVKANGSRSEYTTSQIISIPLVKAPLTNKIVVMGDGTAGAFQFTLSGTLYDGSTRNWVS